MFLFYLIPMSQATWNGGGVSGTKMVVKMVLTMVAKMAPRGAASDVMGHVPGWDFWVEGCNPALKTSTSGVRGGTSIGKAQVLRSSTSGPKLVAKMAARRLIRVFH